MCQLTSQMKPNRAQMIDVVNTRIVSATHDGRLNFCPNCSATVFNQVIRWVRCAQPTHSITALMIIAAIERPMTWLRPAPRAGGSARTVSSIVVPPHRTVSGGGTRRPLTYFTVGCRVGVRLNFARFGVVASFYIVADDFEPPLLRIASSPSPLRGWWCPHCVVVGAPPVADGDVQHNPDDNYRRH